MNSYIKKLKQVLPEILFGVNDLEKLIEIRIRAEKCVYLVFSDKRHVLDKLISRREFDDIILRLCGGSLYKHESTLTEGFFTDVFGGRCGVAGNLIFVNGVARITELTSLNIRIPRTIKDAGIEIYNYLESQGGFGGVILIGKPGSGKTTILKSLASLLSEAGKSVCVVDDRREFMVEEYSPRANIDLLCGFSKWRGIEIALRTLCSEVIICDELGTDDMTDTLSNVASSGVPLIASAHGSCHEELLTKPFFKEAVKKGIFKHYVNLKDNFRKEIGSFV